MNTKLIKKIPIEHVIQLKTIDLLSYLKQYEPNSIIKNKSHYDSITHNSLIIYKNRWAWKSHHLNGKTAIQYLVFVEEMDYIDALYLLYQCYSKELNNGKKIHQ